MESTVFKQVEAQSWSGKSATKDWDPAEFKDVYPEVKQNPETLFHMYLELFTSTRASGVTVWIMARVTINPTKIPSTTHKTCNLLYPQRLHPCTTRLSFPHPSELVELMVHAARELSCARVEVAIDPFAVTVH